jgi:hypothetical protein
MRIPNGKHALAMASGISLVAALVLSAAFATGAHAAPRQMAFAARGGLDCNGFSTVQRPIRAHDTCADFKDPDGSGGRGYDNGHYIGHDEPSLQFLSNAAGSGNNTQWQITLPRERPLPATQTLENQVAFWFSMALCDPNSFPKGACTPDSDGNNPNAAGSAFLEMQFYPPGNPPFINNISCDFKHWCASLHINSLEVMSNGELNPVCTEPTNFAFIQRNGVPTGPAGPDNQTNASFTPNAQTLLMNQGDQLRITIRDTTHGVMTRIDDLSAGRSGFMVASAANGYQTLNPDTCAGTNFDFHPEFSTAKFGNFVPWAALQANVGFASEIGHFTPGANGDNDADDAPCFASGVKVPGCLDFAQGGDVDFDGTSYLPDWPDGTRHNATSLKIGSVAGNGVGPLSRRGDSYSRAYPQVIFETDVAASESTCNFTTGAGCVVPPPGAAFYPFYSLARHRGGGDDEGDRRDSHGSCYLAFGNDIAGATVNDFGKLAQYGSPNLAWFAGTLSGGVQANPCLPHDD